MNRNLIGAIIAGILLISGLLWYHFENKTSKPVTAPVSSFSQTTPSTPVTVVPPTCTIFYTVKSKDALDEIAERFGVDATDLATWNNISDPNLINTGQQICLVPPGTTSFPSNNTCQTLYYVRSGDTLISIAQNFKLPLKNLMSANNIANENLINTGDVLCIPVYASS